MRLSSIKMYVLTSVLCLFSLHNFAQTDTTKEKDSTKKATKELPLEPTRKIEFTTNTGTWISVD
ncbi:MAG: hypothetical protein HKN99_09720, partial [Winogradskyella sp.]|nr:hypothetical protein [Winogradskyella sp.]